MCISMPCESIQQVFSSGTVAMVELCYSTLAHTRRFLLYEYGTINAANYNGTLQNRIDIGILAYMIETT